MGHKCFISYKKEDQWYRNQLDTLLLQTDLINKGLDKTIDSFDGDYIMKSIRENYLQDSTVTIFMIGLHSSENEGVDIYGRKKNYFIQRELQASLYNGIGNTRNGILGVVLPEMYDEIFRPSYRCPVCGNIHQHVALNDSTVIREFSENYFITPHDGCAWSEDERYCVLTKWNAFIEQPAYYVEQAFFKRSSEIASKVTVRVNRN